MEGEIPTNTISLETDTNTRETDQIVMDMLYKADINDYISKIIKSEQNLCKSHTVI